MSGSVSTVNGDVHDGIRGVKGSFEDALQGIRRVRDVGIRVGLRFTIHAKNMHELEGIFQLMQDEGVPRCCIYHLAYAGRGEKLQRYDLDPQETRDALAFIFDRAQELHAKGIELDTAQDELSHANWELDAARGPGVRSYRQ